MYVISYCALGLLALMMVGLVAYDALTRLWRERPKRLWECVISAADLDLSAMPEALFLRAAERIGFNSNMDDFDGDGLPNLYELHHGTNPYVPDAALAPRLSLGTLGGYGSLKAALAASSAFSIVDVAAGDYPQDATIVMPPHPVLVSGPTGGYAVIRSTAPIAAFELNAAQTESTLFRNLYLVLDAQSGFQSGFWCGGNLPWSGESASATFRNVRIAFRNPEPEYFGWHFYRPGMNRAVIADCLVDALGFFSQEECGRLSINP